MTPSDGHHTDQCRQMQRNSTSYPTSSHSPKSLGMRLRAMNHDDRELKSASLSAVVASMS